MYAALRTLLLSIFLLWGVGSSVNAAEFSDSQRKEMEAIIKDYLLANPDLLRDMGQLLEQKEKLAEDQQRKGALVSNADQIFRDGTDFVAGNPKGSDWYSTPKERRTRLPIELTLSFEAHRKLRKLAAKSSVSRSAIVEQLILAATL